MLDDELLIETPERVELHYVLANVGNRFLAAVIDHLIQILLALTIVLIINGIGEWTSDIYLLMALLRPDVMPKGDIALHTAWHRLSGESRPTADEFLEIAERWRPYRSVAARMLWHFYLCQKRKPER